MLAFRYVFVARWLCPRFIPQFYLAVSTCCKSTPVFTTHAFLVHRLESACVRAIAFMKWQRIQSSREQNQIFESDSWKRFQTYFASKIKNCISTVRIQVYIHSDSRPFMNERMQISEPPKNIPQSPGSTLDNPYTRTNLSPFTQPDEKSEKLFVATKTKAKKKSAAPVVAVNSVAARNDKLGVLLMPISSPTRNRGPS